MSGAGTSLPRGTAEALRRSMRDLCFRATATDGPPLVGAELELIPVRAATGERVLLDGPGASTLQIVRGLAARRGWRERRSAKGTPYFTLPEGTLSFEPGGQVELSADPVPSVTALAERLDRVVRSLDQAAESHGVALVGIGIDPVTTLEQVPLQLEAERYVRMSEYLQSVGSYGARMMRQTASIQVSLDAGSDPVGRWRLLDALAPFVTAIFANSPRYAGALTHHQSYRAHCWRMLDKTRTGVRAGVEGESALDAYLDFALAAPDLMRRDVGGAWLPFADWAARGDWSLDAWETHLSTLFPEVRPRGHLEVRSADSQSLEWVAVPLVFLTGLAYDAEAGEEALALAHDSAELLAEGGRRGLRHPRIGAVARDLAALALEGAARLGDAYVDAATRERAAAFFERYTLAGRSPADDVRDAILSAVPPAPAREPAA